MELQDKIDKLKDARDSIAAVYEDEATDDIIDDGNLSVLNAAVLSLNKSITTLSNRTP